ncbi:biofilm-associated protein [Nitrosopumilus sp. S4]
MNKSSTRGIFLSTALLLSIILITNLPNSFAEEVNVKSIALEETTIIELTNDSTKDINTFRIWLGSDFSFKSFKTEKGWVGEKTPQGVIIFTSSETIKPGESVKFGVKTDKAKPGINWKALDKNDKQLDTGKVLAGDLPKVIENTQPKQTQPTDNITESISLDSTFRIIPEKPNVGSTIRVTGEKFGASEEFDFYINSKKIGSFQTDSNGHFMTTMKIPETENADRVDFKIQNKAGEEKKISLRIGGVDNRIPVDDVKLTVQGVPSVIKRGDILDIFGTGKPGSAIKADIYSPEGVVINSRTATIDSKGNWKLPEPIMVPLDSLLGEYKSTISDGRQTIEIKWKVEPRRVIIINPIDLQFELGDIMKFNGTAIPNVPMELRLEDPIGKEVFSDIIQVDETGLVEFEYQTTMNSPKGTYTLIAAQEKNKELIFAGLGQLAVIPVNLEFDKLNYKATETAIITFSGQPSDVVSLLIVDPGDKPKESDITIQLLPDGRGKYSLPLKGYASGVYTAVVQKGSAQSSETFTVGLQVGSGEIDINTTKVDYNPGDSVLVLGNTGPNIILTLSLIDPEGNEVKIRETYSDKTGKISEDSFRIPSDAEPGVWTIKAKSGANFDITEINVLGVVKEGMVVVVTDAGKLDGINEFINIHIFGAKQTVKITILSDSGEQVEKLEFPSSKSGEINQPWKIPKDAVPGTYTLKASDAFNEVETTFEI